jgi:hypothetical protein
MNRIKILSSTFQTRWTPPAHIADILLKQEKKIRKNPLDDAPGRGPKVKFAPEPSKTESTDEKEKKE